MTPLVLPKLTLMASNRLVFPFFSSHYLGHGVRYSFPRQVLDFRDFGSLHEVVLKSVHMKSVTSHQELMMSSKQSPISIYSALN